MEEVGRNENSFRLSSVPLDWRFVFWQVTLIACVLLFQGAVTGTFLSLAMLLLWKRWADWREAVVALFIVACVLASSRFGGLQYWKMLRLGFAGLVFIEAIRTLRELPLELRRGSLTFTALVAVCTGIPALLSSHVMDGLEEMVLLSSMW